MVLDVLLSKVYVPTALYVPAPWLVVVGSLSLVPLGSPDIGGVVFVLGAAMLAARYAGRAEAEFDRSKL